MAENKTRPTTDSVEAFVDSVDDAQKRADSKTIIALMQDITGEPPVLWGPAIIGFGQYHYKYDSGREGDMPIVGFSPRKQNLSLYIMSEFEGRDTLLSKLGKFKTSKACLYVKKLADINQNILRELISESVRITRETQACTSCGK